MTAYLIADTNVHDPVSYEQYKALARPIAEKFGGEYLVRGESYASMTTISGHRLGW